MEIKKIESNQKPKIMALLYGTPGAGKTTALGFIAEKCKGRTLILDVDRTVEGSLGKTDVIHDASRIDRVEIDTGATWKSWDVTLREIWDLKQRDEFPYENIAVDNISELEKCLLADLGRQGKNQGVPAQADYQYVQYRIMNSLRTLKALGINVYLTAWEAIEQVQNLDGTSYSRFVPSISAKILPNVCGLCNIVARVMANSDGDRGMILQTMSNVYAKNQIDDRKGCKLNEFI